MAWHFVLVGTRSLTLAPRTHDRRRQRGDTYSAAARHLANRFVGILYHCLPKGIGGDEAKAFPPDVKIATWLLPHVRCLRRVHYEFGMDVDPRHRLPAAFAELARTI